MTSRALRNSGTRCTFPEAHAAPKGRIVGNHPCNMPSSARSSNQHLPEPSTCRTRWLPAAWLRNL